jgi:putative protease
MEYYKSEIAKCTYRQFTTGFYFGRTDSESQIYDSNTYIKNYTYIGTVRNLTEDGLVTFEQKNKFSVGEELECMNFDGTNTPCTVLQIYNEKMEPIESAPHPKEQLHVKLDKPVEPGMILRRCE